MILFCCLCWLWQINSCNKTKSTCVKCSLYSVIHTERAALNYLTPCLSARWAHFIFFPLVNRAFVLVCTRQSQTGFKTKKTWQLPTWRPRRKKWRSPFNPFSRNSAYCEFCEAFKSCFIFHFITAFNGYYSLSFQLLCTRQKSALPELNLQFSSVLLPFKKKNQKNQKKKSHFVSSSYVLLQSHYRVWGTSQPRGGVRSIRCAWSVLSIQLVPSHVVHPPVSSASSVLSLSASSCLPGPTSPPPPLLTVLAAHLKVLLNNGDKKASQLWTSCTLSFY